MSGKVPRSYADQLAILEGRGLSVADKAKALHWLSHLNYYRFKLYASVFWVPGQARYAEGTSIDDVLWVYRFDQGLRELVLSAIKCVEVSVPKDGLHRCNLSSKTVINVGSVGLPRGDDKRAAWATYDPTMAQVHFRRTTYDIAETIRTIRHLHLDPIIEDKLFKDLGVKGL